MFRGKTVHCLLIYCFILRFYINQSNIANMPLFVKKPLNQLMAQADESEKGLKRTLGSVNLILLGIGAIIGAGLFVRTAAAAGLHAGPAVTVSFIIAAVG